MNGDNMIKTWQDRMKMNLSWVRKMVWSNKRVLDKTYYLVYETISYYKS